MRDEQASKALAAKAVLPRDWAMKRIFVYEYLSGGGPVAGTDAHRSELLAMGRAMRDAITADLLRARRLCGVGRDLRRLPRSA